MSSVTIEGVCEQIMFHNESNGYTVFKVKVDRRKVTCVGVGPQIKVGQTLHIEGKIEENPKYGQQINCEVITVSLPKDKIGIIKYLSSGVIPGIGEGFAKKLVDFAGTKLFDVLDKNPESLYAIPGIGKKRIQLLAQNWQDYRNAHEVLMFLQKFGVGAKRSMMIYQTYQADTLNILQTNPYQIYQDITGIGFKIADKIAQSMGLASDDPYRVVAGIHYCLEQSTQSGHCFLTLDQCYKNLVQILSLDHITNFEQHLQHNEFVLDGEHLYLKKTYQAEQQVAASINRISSDQSIWQQTNITRHTHWIENQKDIELSLSQTNALYTILNSKIGIITGGPGVGKTTITKCLIGLAKQAKINVMLCAPTGRAAKKLAASTQLEAKTIHRLLKVDPIDKKFQHNRNNPLNTDLLIIDEASMIDIFLANNLLQAIDSSTNIVVIGDIDQLPSVGPGAFLKDLITLFPDSTAQLTEIFRQAKGSHIIQNAHRVNQGKMLIPNSLNDTTDFYFIAENDPEAIIDKTIRMVTQRIPKRFNLNPLEDIQVLSPMHKGILGTQNLNQQLQRALNSNTTIDKLFFKVGDKVIQTRNNYDKEVFNGDVGYIDSIHSEQNELSVCYHDRTVHYLFSELDEIQLAYAITIHKSQGSEYPAVILPITMSHFPLLERNLLYTAITRGKKLVVLVGEMKAIAMAIRNKKSKNRNTALCMLKEDL